MGFQIIEFGKYFPKNVEVKETPFPPHWTSPMNTPHIIRHLVAKALYIKQLTPDIENEINYELTRLGYISDVDYEALELLMSEMDAGRVRLVPSP
jgi:hypothetical protein